MSRQLVNPQAMVRALLDACPGSRAVTTCGRCGQVIIGFAALNERGAFIHPDDCTRPKQLALL